MKNLFIAAGDVTWGSSRLRCYWPASHMSNTDVIINGSTISLLYDNYIFQKFASVDTLKTLKVQNKKTYLDLCDPTWWWQPEQVQECLAYLDGVVCCTDALAHDFYETYGILPKVIPDRLELSHYSNTYHQRTHSEVLPIRFIWYGVAVNRIGIFAALANLERLVANGYDIELTIMDNQPEQPFVITDMFPIYHIKWSLAQEVEIITSHDIALLGEYPGAWGKVKSNNRELTAWACGLPATKGNEYQELENLADWAYRDLQQEMNNARLESEFDVKQSALEWEGLLGVA